MNELLPWSRREETAETSCMLPLHPPGSIKVVSFKLSKIMCELVAYKDRWRGDGDSVLVCYYFSHTFLV